MANYQLDTEPLVSVGLPVFNGENYLDTSARSVLAQTYGNFELIISDNASTDGTSALCAELAAADPRVKVIRQPENIGAAPNFNVLPSMAKGRYFKWMAHDDVIAPTFLEKCVAALEAEPAATLCYADAEIIDEAGAPIERYENPLDLSGRTPEARFAELVKFHLSARYEIFGVFRMSALDGTDLISGFTDGDGVLLAHAGLKGSILRVPEPLFYPRRHAMQSQRLLADKRVYDEWFDPANAGKARMPHFRLFGAFFDLPRRAPLTSRQKWLCRLSVARQALRRHNLLRGDLLRRFGGPLGAMLGRLRRS